MSVMTLHAVLSTRQASLRTVARIPFLRACFLLLLFSLFFLSSLASPSADELRQGVPADVTTFPNWVDYLQTNEFFKGSKSGTPKYGQMLKQARSIWADVMRDRRSAASASASEQNVIVTAAAPDAAPAEKQETTKEQQQQQQEEVAQIEEPATSQPPLAQTKVEPEVDPTKQPETELETQQQLQSEQQQTTAALEQTKDQLNPELISEPTQEAEPAQPPRRHRKVEARRPPTTTSEIISESTEQRQQRWGRRLLPDPAASMHGENPHRYPPGQAPKKKQHEHSSYYDRPRVPSAQELEASCAWYVREQKYETLKEQIFMQEDATMFQVEQPYALPEENLQFMKRKRNTDIVQELTEKRKAMEAALAQIEKELSAASAAAIEPAGSAHPSSASPVVEYSCSWQFSHYSPSDWEVTWATHITDIDLHQGICPRLRTQEELERSVYMLKRIEEFTYRENNEKNRQVRNTVGEPYNMDLPEDMRSSYRSRPASNNQNVSPLSAARKLRKQNEAAEELDKSNKRIRPHDTTIKRPPTAAEELAAEEAVPSWKSRTLSEEEEKKRKVIKYGLELFKAELEREARMSNVAAAAAKEKPLSLKDISAQLYQPDAIPSANDPANYAAILHHYEARRRIVDKELKRRQTLAEKEAQLAREEMIENIKALNQAEFARRRQKQRAVLDKQFTSTRIVVDTTLNTIGNIPRGETAPLLDAFPEEPESKAVAVVEEPKAVEAPAVPPPQQHNPQQQHVQTPAASTQSPSEVASTPHHAESVAPSNSPAVSSENIQATNPSEDVHTPTASTSEATADGLSKTSDEELAAELQKIQSQLDALNSAANAQQATSAEPEPSLERHAKRLLAQIQTAQPIEQIETSTESPSSRESDISPTTTPIPEPVEAVAPVDASVDAVADSPASLVAAATAPIITEPFEIVEEELRLGTAEEGATAARRRLFSFDSDDTPAEPAPTISWADFGVDAVNPPRPLQIGTIEYVRDVADQLFSRMNYNLICRAGGGAYEPNWASTQQSAVFTVAKGFDFIEPLIGLLRDPLTMCDKPLYVPLHLREFLDTSAYGDVQSKRHLLMQAATPFQITIRPVTPPASDPSSTAQGKQDVDGVLPSWYTESTAKQIRTAIEAVAGGSGLPPWVYKHSYPIPHSASGGLNTNPPRFRSEPLQPSYPSRVAISPNMEASQVLERPHVKQSARSEDEEHTAIILNNKSEVSVPAALAVDNHFSNPRSRRRSRSAPRVLLFDLGASYFVGWRNALNALGSAWFYQQLAQKGLTIDRVYAWEYETLDPVVEWKSIPAELYSEFSFINTGVTSDPSQNTNPWNTLLEVARPIDYVIVKLDIDSAWIEGPLMEQLLNTPNIQMLIDEMFFEHHVDVEAMRSSWGLGLPQKMGDSYDWFTVLRQTGIRMHSWP